MDDIEPQNNKDSDSDSDIPQIVSIPIYPTGIYTYKEAAALSKCSYATIWRAVVSGKLKASTIGNQPRIIGAELLKWIEQGGETGRSKATI